MTTPPRPTGGPPPTPDLGRVAPEAAVVAAVAFAAAVALTPPGAAWLYALDGAALAAVGGALRLPVGFVTRRLLVLAPLVAVAAVLPLVAAGDDVAVAGVALSEAGLRSAGHLLAKAALGAGAAIVLVGALGAGGVLRGLARLRVPAALVGVAGFMLRYLDLVAAELGRVRMAMAARGHRPRWLGHAAPLGAGVGALFVRTYERGERVHAAMGSRGFTGTLPDLGDGPSRGERRWWPAAVAPALAWAGLLWAAAR